MHGVSKKSCSHQRNFLFRIFRFLISSVSAEFVTFIGVRSNSKNHKQIESVVLVAIILLHISITICLISFVLYSYCSFLELTRVLSLVWLSFVNFVGGILLGWLNGAHFLYIFFMKLLEKRKTLN